ncbi:DUF1707 domain-containing protein [Microtetraspora sp. NBRC 16547]|uniref:DUF1707 SHOCT-like domain-containing protein n=1 Tax=Microtetraspora sp. NBRC 16547 TaxID=3030993 RepID=UPI0024A57D15|nr:DUF1707 domain-containing protein [Microtetraspora sp. NBRC 16547]GLW96301.1 hypothetical protein Misp02_03880 [Microtetraspora sp. NBRC 16547]
MAATPEMRASDGDRDRVAAALREHVAEGRLTVDEFNERLAQLYQSRTYGELATLTADLPDIDLHRLPATVSTGSRPRPKRGGQPGLKAAWAAWATASAINWVIWLIVVVTSVEWVYPWPLWVMGPWGAVLLVGTVFGREHRRP